MDRPSQNDVTGAIVDAALTVHTALGTGLSESAYEAYLAVELQKRGFDMARQIALPPVYDGLQVEAAYRIDFVVSGSVIVELKGCNSILRIHKRSSCPVSN